MGKSNDIGAAVIDDLTFDPDVDASDIRVEETDGDVVLTGSVPSYPQYVQAAAVAARAVGVRCVRNHLQITLPPGDHRDDLTDLRGIVGEFGDHPFAAARFGRRVDGEFDLLRDARGHFGSDRR